MATLTLTVGPFFADGATLGAYRFLSDDPDGSAPPVAATSTGTVSAGSVTLTGLAAGARYWIGTGSAPYRYLGAQTAEAAAAGASTASAVSFTPGGTVAATDVQAAILEVAAESVGSSSTVTSAAANLKTTYGAVGDGRYVLDAATTSGNGTVTSATAAFAGGDVGKAVAVYDGTTGAQLAVGTVASRGSGTSITLSANATASATSCLLVIGTDDTVAIQAAFTAMAAAGGACYVPPGLYMVAGAQQTVTVGSQTYSGQILVPGRNVSVGMVPIRIFGDLPAGGTVTGEDISQAPAPVQTGFFSTAMTGACISGQGTTANDTFAAVYGAFARWSEHDLTLERVSFHAAIDPAVTMVRGDTFGCVSAHDVRITPLANAQTIGARGFSRGGTALSLSSQFNQTKVAARRVTINGFATGLTHSEHAYLDEVDIEVCDIGIAFQHSPNGYHGPVYGRVLVQSCAVALQNRSTGQSVAAFSGNLYTEGGGANGTIAPVCIIDDPSNWLIGQLNVSTANFGAGWSLSEIRVKGATGMRLTNLRSGSTSTTSTSASTPTGAPKTPPGQPTGLTATAGNTQVSLSWTAPASSGGTSITDYVVQYRLTGAGSWSTFADGTSTTASATVTGLTNASGYDFQVAAVNSAGTGTYSSTATATPTSSATVPAQVTGLTATPGNAQVALSWSAPSNGGSAITDYLVEQRVGAGSWSTVTDGVSTVTSYTVTGLTNGTGYGFRVSAINAIGTGTASTEATATPVNITTLVSENFTKSNGSLSGTSPQTTPGGAWITQAFGLSTTPVSLQVASNIGVQTASSPGQNANVVNVAQTSYTASVTIKVGTTGSRCNLGMFIAAGTTYGTGGYQVSYDASGQISLYRTKVGATGTFANVGVQTAGTSHVVKAVVTPTQIDLYFDGVYKTTYNPTTGEQSENSTYCGPAAYQGTGNNDDGTGTFTNFVVTS